LNGINSELLTHPSAVEYFSIWSEIEQDMAKGGIFSINFDMEEGEKHTLLKLGTWVHDQVQKHNPEWAQMIKTVNESVVLYSDVSIYNAIFNQSLIVDHVNNVRDEYMAENLLFLLEEKYADKKVILFGATYHFLRNNSALIHQPESQVPIEKSTIAVDIIYPQLKDDLYVIGFTSGSGYYGNVDVGEQGDEVPTPVENSLEAQLLKTDLDNVFISLRHTKSAPEFWEFGPHLNLFYYDIGYASKQWNNVLDALVYIRDMEPIYERESDD
jgi:erythromycin esterase-like protein